MEKQANIQNYSFYNDYTVSYKGENNSSIVTKMVQLAGRLCERYASDIIYDANAFIRAIDEHKDFDEYLFFRESGVTAFTPEDVGAIESTDYIQAWHLTYKAETEEQEFTRVSINFEKRYW